MCCVPFCSKPYKYSCAVMLMIQTDLAWSWNEFTVKADAVINYSCLSSSLNRVWPRKLSIHDFTLIKLQSNKLGLVFCVWYFNGCQHVPLNVGFKNINCLPFRFLSKQIMKSLVESSWVKWRKFCHQIAPSCIITLFCQIIQSLVKIIFRIFKMWAM